MKRKLPSHKLIDQISIETSSLKLLLKDYITNVRKQRDWVSWLGIEITLLLALFFTDFKTVWIIPETYVESFVILLTVLVSALLFKSVIDSFRLRKQTSLEYLMDTIMEKSTMPYERRMLFVLKKHADGNTKILVFKDSAYDCYMLPHLKIEDTYNEKKAKFKVAEYLSIPEESIRIEEYDREYDKVSVKYSEYHHKQTCYYFSFCYVKIINPPDNICNDEFQVEGRDFRWMSCQSLDEDENTRKKNSDVVRHITDYSTDMLGSRVDSLEFK